MRTRIVMAGVCALLLGSSVWAGDNPKDAAAKPDQAQLQQLKKQCGDMKNMDMSKMSSAEHEAMMKKCKEMMSKHDSKESAPTRY